MTPKQHADQRRQKQLLRLGRECVRELTNPVENGTVTVMEHMPRYGFVRGKVIGEHNHAPIRIYDAEKLLKYIQQWMTRHGELWL
jgi:hypothetical protein